LTFLARGENTPSRNFHFGFPAHRVYSQSPSLCVVLPIVFHFFHPERLPKVLKSPRRAQENLNLPDFMRFLYTSPPLPSLQLVYFFASVYPVAVGNAAILRTIPPNSRRVR
jgi:hypothetical protein